MYTMGERVALQTKASAQGGNFMIMLQHRPSFTALSTHIVSLMMVLFQL